MRIKRLLVSLLVAGLLLSAGCSAPVNKLAEDAQANPQAAAAGPGLKQIDMVDGKYGWGISANGVLYTSSGGKLWKTVTPRGTQGLKPGVAAFWDRKNAWVTFDRRNGGQLSVYHTADAGKTWMSSPIRAQEPNPYPSAVTLDFIDRVHGWLLVSYGVAAGSEEVEVYATSDGVKKWARISSSQKSGELPRGGLKSSLGFLDTRRGWLTGLWYGDTIWLYQSRDGGKHWMSQQVPIPGGFSAEGGSAESLTPIFKDKARFLPVVFRAQGQAVIFYQLDRRGNWVPTTPVQPVQHQSLIWSFVNGKNGIATDGTYFYATSDGCKTWKRFKPNREAPHFTKIDFISPGKGFGISAGQVWQTRDGAHTWTLITPVPQER